MLGLVWDMFFGPQPPKITILYFFLCLGVVALFIAAILMYTPPSSAKESPKLTLVALVSLLVGSLINI
jgi:hypothetical protein